MTRLSLERASLLAVARAEAKFLGDPEVLGVHLLCAATKVGAQPVEAGFRRLGLDATTFRRRLRAKHLKVRGARPLAKKRIGLSLEASLVCARAAAGPGAGPFALGVLVCGLHRGCPAVEQTLRSMGGTRRALLGALRENLVLGTRPLRLGAALARRPTPLLDRYGRDLSALARQGRLGPVFGRDAEVLQVAEALARKAKNNPVLVGEPGVGKTAIVEALACRASADPVLARLFKDLRVVEISPGALVAGTKHRGDLEERVLGILREAQSDPNLTLFVDELHLLLDAGASESSPGLASFLKPPLARGELRLIGATTPREMRKIVVGDPALERRFLPVVIDEPTTQEALEIAQRVAVELGFHHGLNITPAAVKAAVELGVRYLPARRLPDKAIDLLDQACASLRLVQGGAELKQDHVEAALAAWTGIPCGGAAEERRVLADLEASLRRRVLGQPQAIARVVARIRQARAGLGDPDRPDGVFLFVGPAGVGKTELAKTLASALFPRGGGLVRFDMSEFQEEHSVSRLIGAPPGYVGTDRGGELTEKVRQRPHCVLLLDEIEKAHPRVVDLFLQVFGEGTLTDAQGVTVDFRNVLVIMTSNLGSQRSCLGFGGQGGEDGLPERSALLEFFRAELLDRVDDIVSFRPLGTLEVHGLLGALLSEIHRRFAARGVTLRVDGAARNELVRLGSSPEGGARRLRRMVEQVLVQPAARRILDGTVSSVRLECVAGVLSLRYEGGGERPQLPIRAAGGNTDPRPLSA